MTDTVVRHFLSMKDATSNLTNLIAFAEKIKSMQKTGEKYTPLMGRSMGMIFEKPSTRTRVSFEVGMTQLGGHALYLSPKDLQLGRGETIGDTARTLSRFVDLIMYRAFKHSNMLELAANATVPVINALDDLEHPCQIMADLLTIKEYKDRFPNLKLVYIGDGNNVCNSLLLGCSLLGMDIVVACPDGYEPDAALLAEAREFAGEHGSKVEVTDNPKNAVSGADVIYTDVWVSMGDEQEALERVKKFKPFQVNSELLAAAPGDAIVMHCLPAHRGQEITDEVVDGPQSVVFDQAENRLHAQKAVMVWLMEGAKVLQ